MQEEGKLVHCGLDDGLIQNGDSDESSWRWWPPYSSTIAFELVQVENETGIDGHFIRVVLNGRALRLIPMMSLEDEKLLNKQPIHKRMRFGEMDEEGMCDMMGIHEFEQMINTLEDAGGGCIFSIEEDTTEQAGRLGVDGG